MTAWSRRSREERTLLNPAFCASLLWHATQGYAGTREGLLSFEEAFLVLPIALHKETREALPRDTRTSLAVWLEDNPLTRGRIASRARLLVPFTKEGITFGGLHGFIRLEDGRLRGDAAWKRPVSRTLRSSSDEVRMCSKRAEFAGKWFALAGSAPTVLAVMGMRP